MFFRTKKKKRILVLLGHPDCDSFSGYLADRYEEGANQGGHDVRRINVGDLKFDPVLHKGYKVIQELEPDLLKVQEDFKWAEHIVILYPNWWCSMPAVLKGMFDRMFLPGFAFRFNKGSMMGTWQRLLKGRTARVILSMNAWPILTRFVMGDYSNEIRRGILWFAGIWPVHMTSFGPVEKATPEQRASWGERIKRMGNLAS